MRRIAGIGLATGWQAIGGRAPCRPNLLPADLARILLGVERRLGGAARGATLHYGPLAYRILGKTMSESKCVITLPLGRAKRDENHGLPV